VNAIEWLLEIPKRNASRDFLVDTVSGQTLTFDDMFQAAITTASDLIDRGIKRGDRIAVLLNNSAEFAKLYFGCLYAGIVVVPINPVLAFDEIDYILQHSGARLLIASAETIGQIDVNAICNTGAQVLVLKDGRCKDQTFDHLEAWDLNALSCSNGFVPFDGMTPDDIMAIVYTSGTTGRPSGVVHRIGAMIDNERLFNQRLGIGAQNRFYGVLAMTYLGGYHNLLMLPYTAEASVVISHTFDARSALQFWEPALEHGVNTLWLVPTIMSILMEMDRGTVGEEFCKEKVKLALVGTAPLPIRLRKDFEKRYGISLYENYGLSETLFISTNAPKLPVLDGSVGRILSGVEVTVLDESGNPLSYGDEGEIWVQTPHIMEGYYDTDTKQPDFMDKQAWFPTGDIGQLAATGELFITGRKKDLIIRGGINISPAAIENILHEHPAVTECAVVGIPHALYGEDIAAVVCLAEDQDFDKVHNELLQACKEGLAAIRQPSHILEVESFEHSSSGKIRKDLVRELLIHKLGLTRLVSHNQLQKNNETSPQIITGRVRRNIDRPDMSLIQALTEYPTSIISDSMNRMGALDGTIHALVKGRSFCGPAITVDEVEGGNLMSHIALELLQEGDVLIIDGKGITSRSCWGGLQTFMAQEKKAAGVVINGMVRDFEDLKNYEIPVYARGVSPNGPFKGWSGNVNHPIACTSVVVSPGDIVRGDDDGVVIVPKDLASKVLVFCEKRLNTEKQWFEAVGSGQSTLDVVGLRDQVEKLGIIFD